MEDTIPGGDARLVTKALDGDMISFGRLVRKYEDAVLAIAFHTTGSFEDSRDIVQDIFVTAYRRLNELRQHERFGPWVRRIAQRRAQMSMRARRTHVPLDDVSIDRLPHDPGPSPDVVAQVNERRVLIQAALERLSDANRLVVTLHYMGDWMGPEVAEFLDVPLSTVEARLFRARQQLRVRLQTVLHDAFEAERSTDEFASDVVALVREYERQFLEDSPSADRTVLRAAEARLPRLEARSSWSFEEVRAARDLCSFCGQNARGVTILKAYLGQRLTVDEEAWARFQLANGYALTRECDSAVATHRAFLEWSRDHLERDRWAWVMMVGSRCWEEIGCGDEWVATFREIAAKVRATR